MSISPQNHSKPGRIRYFASGLMMFLGVVLFIAWLLWRILPLGKDWPRLLAPGNLQSTFKSGQYTIFFERLSQIDGKVYHSSTNIDGLKCQLTDIVNRKAIHLQETAMSMKYSLPGHEGVGIWRFSLPQAATLRIECDYEEELERPKVILAIGQDFIETILITVFGSLAILFSTFFLGIGVAIHTFVKRRANAKS